MEKMEQEGPSQAPKDLEGLAQDLSALSNLQRLRLVHLLTKPRYAEEIAKELGMSRQSALKHIEKLEERGIVRSLHGRRETGPVIEYMVVPQRLFALGIKLNDLGKLEPEGGPAVRHVERTQQMTDPGDNTPPAPEQADGRGHLLILDGPHQGTRYQLEGDGPRWTVGREQDRDLRIKHDPFVSSSHAEIQVDWQGVSLVDVFSSNGTFVNFTKLPRGGRVPLKVGDVVGIGHTNLVYQKD